MGSGVSLALLPPNRRSPKAGAGAPCSGTRDEAAGAASGFPYRSVCSGLARPSAEGTGGLAASCLSSSGSDLACRAISTGRLNALPRLHLRPIDVVVFHGPQGRPGFEGGFPLRCLQRLSCPHIATLHCGWRHNSSTSGAFTPVLSY
jgi:hypothetical protein